MTYIYYDQKGKIKMLSENKLECSDLLEVKKTLTTIEKEKLANSYKYHNKVVDRKLEFTEKEFVKKAKGKEEILADLQSGKDPNEIIKKLLDII